MITLLDTHDAWP